MSLVEFTPKKRATVAAVAAVTGIYVYFLLFAEFALLEIGRSALGDPARRGLLAALGMAGAAGSLLAAWVYAVERCRGLLSGGFGACALAAAVAVLAPPRPGLWIAAGLVGASTGWTTVILAATLRRVLGSARLGSGIGVGTGLAYAICNLPQVFTAAPARQAGIAVAAAIMGMLAVQLFNPAAPAEKPAAVDYTPRGVGSWIVIFFALVALDSAVFNIIQQSPALKQETWSGTGRLYVNALVHLIVAVLAGYVLDRRRTGTVATAAMVAVMIAAVLIDEKHGRFASVGTLIYAAGVSAYSAALVFFPARGARPWPAAAIYAVAGWGGSALGLGLSAGRHEVSPWLIAVAGGAVAGALAVRQVWRRREAKEWASGRSW